MIRTNFHTHTQRCHHAYGSDEDFVKSAIQNEYKVLGFSDHCCWKYKGLFKSGIRMTIHEFNDYKRSVLSLKEKYKSQIEIRLGMEAEYFPDYMDWMLDFCIEKDIDYLIFGNHYYQSDAKHIYYGYCDEKYIANYFDDCIKGMETGMYAYLAHPELIMRNDKLDWNDQIEEGFHRVCQKAKELDIPLEYNGLGLQTNIMYGKEQYPNSKFWKIASQYHNKAIIGMDAHEPSDLNKSIYLMAYDNLSEYDVEIIDDIPKIDYRKLKEYKINHF